MLHSNNITLDKGLNYLDYNLTIDADKLGQLTKELKKAKKGEEESLVKKADDNFYLIPGEYKVEIAINGEVASSQLKVVEGRRRPSRGGK